MPLPAARGPGEQDGGVAPEQDEWSAPGAPPVLVEPPATERPVVEAPAPAPSRPVTAPELSRRGIPRVVLPGGLGLDLDVPVYLGRKPSVPRVAPGPVRLVALPAPLKEISATHLELRVVGDALVATDMRSTNGTLVEQPGALPRRLIHGDSLVVVPGARLDLGEGVVLAVLPPETEEDS